MMISASGQTHIGGSRNRENQDAFYVGDRRFCVIDGHGSGGRSVAETARASFAAAAADQSLEGMFAEAEAAVRAVVGSTSGAGGATASVLQIDADGSCRVAAVGDSDVRIFDDDEGDGIPLTMDHGACSLDEFRRIHAVAPTTRFEFSNPAGYYYDKKPVFILGADDEWMPDPTGGRMYCTVRKDWSAYVIGPGGEQLAITRALGDFNMKAGGVIATPTVMSAAPASAGVVRAIVMASDGLWDAMQYADVRAIVRNPALVGNAEAATAALMEAALTAGATHFGSHSDNVTALVVYVTV